MKFINERMEEEHTETDEVDSEQEIAKNKSKMSNLKL